MRKTKMLEKGKGGEVKRPFATKNPQIDGKIEQRRAALVRYRVKIERKQEESLVDKMEKWLREGSHETMEKAIANIHKLSNEELYLVFFRIYQDRKGEFKVLEEEIKDTMRKLKRVRKEKLAEIRAQRPKERRKFWKKLKNNSDKVGLALLLLYLPLYVAAPMLGKLIIREYPYHFLTTAFLAVTISLIVKRLRTLRKIEGSYDVQKTKREVKHLKALKKLANGKWTNLDHIESHARYMLEDGTPLFVRAYERGDRRAMELLLLLSWDRDYGKSEIRERYSDQCWKERTRKEEKFNVMCEALFEKFTGVLALGNYEKALEIAKSWNPQTVDKEGRTLMHYAFMQGEYTPEFIELLAKMESLGYDIEGPLDVYGKRPVDYASGSVLRFLGIEETVEQEEESEEKAAANVSDNSQAQHGV